LSDQNMKIIVPIVILLWQFLGFVLTFLLFPRSIWWVCGSIFLQLVMQ